ncbi:MAG: hypothetical protein GY926_01090, partial [bacterium]|nr:hypothetical protein [bacterium]
TNQTVTADWATANGTATSPGDYTAASGAISIASGVSTDTINVTLTDDDAVEGIETFTVGLTNAANATIATPTGTATITDDDVATVAFEVATSNENEAASPHDIPVVLSVPGGGTLAAEVTVAIPTPGGSATGSGTDYTLSTSVLTFLIGSGDGASETISLAIEDDSTVESDETVTLALGTVTGPATTSGITSHIHTIADNDIATVAFTNASSNAPEEASPHTLTVTLDIIGTPGATLASAVTVPITDTGGSASGGDYDLDTTSVTFSSGSGDGATRIVSLTIDDDASEESNETIGLGLGTPTAPVTKSGQTTHTVTIIDDESRNITVTPTSGSTVVSEAAGVDTFTVRLTQAPLSGTVTVTLSKSAEGDEFTVSPAQLTFSTDWATPKTVTVTGVNNDIVDGNRAGEVLMSAANGGYSGVTATESVTITDDDVAGVTITESGGTSVVEGSTATDTYTIVLDAEPIANVVVTLISDDEITTSPESVTFTPSNWNTPRTVTVSGVEDGIDELEEDHTIAHTVSSADSMFHNVPMGSVVVSVEDSDELVVVISGPSVGAPGVTSTFEATVNAGGTGDITYQWTAYLGGDPVDTGSIASFDFTPTEGGIYLIEAIVGDSQEQNPAVFIQFRVLGDVGNSIFVNDIVWLAEEGITRGCNPPLNTEYCPTQLVTREQMAAFLVRFLDLTDDGGGNKFVDDDTSIFQDDIAKLAAAGITRGCNPPANTNFCPTQSVTREQMAAFLVRALNLTDDGGGNKFVDDDASIFQDEIAKLAAAGITLGCNPPANTNFCPTQDVTRGQMAAFLRRADAIVNP